MRLLSMFPVRNQRMMIRTSTPPTATARIAPEPPILDSRFGVRRLDAAWMIDLSLLATLFIQADAALDESPVTASDGSSIQSGVMPPHSMCHRTPQGLAN